MIPFIRTFSLLLLFITAQLTTAHRITNEVVKQVTDVASSIAISKATVTMRNDDANPAEFFYVALPDSISSSVADLWIVTTDHPKNALRIQQISSTHLSGADPSSTIYQAFFASPLKPTEKVTVEIRTDVSNVVKPVPATISTYDSQYIKYNANAYFFSPYQTESMETTLILASQVITTKEGLIDPFTITNKRVKMGPYKDVEPFSYSPISIRFKNDRALLVATRAIKQFYVSHWGTIATKEEYFIANAAATHTGEWSRADHGRHSSKYPTAAGDIWANLPSHATRVVYKDLVGNITTSHLRKPTKTKRPIQLSFRFPLMGGWRNHFWITYDTLLSKYAVSNGNEHVLTLPMFPSANIDLFCEQLELRILLPEGAHSIELIDHPSVAFDATVARERTTLTVLGRPVLTLRKEAIRSQSKHVPTVTIRYRYNTLLIWITPVVVGLVILSSFVLCILCVRNGLTVVDEERLEHALKVKTT